MDDTMPDHLKVVGLSDGAFRLYVSGLCYCGRMLTDGLIPTAAVRALTPAYKPTHVKELTRAGLWTAAPGGYHVHDYLEWNRSRADVNELRDKRRKAGKAGAEKRWQK